MSRRVSLGAALFFLLLAASVTTAVLVVRARTPDLVLEVTRQCPPGADPGDCSPLFDPRGRKGPKRIEIEFFVRESDGAAFVGIADSHENVVRTLDASVALAADEPVSYIWDGRTDDGRLAAPGRYRLRVDLPSEEREMIWPRRIFMPAPGVPAPTGADGGTG